MSEKNVLKIPVLMKILEERGMANKISKATGISSGNISDWKSGKSSPNLEAIAKIADYLGCSVDYLIGRTDNQQAHVQDNDLTNNNEYMEIVKLFQALSPEDFDLVKRLIEQLVSKQIPPSPKNDGETKT